VALSDNDSRIPSNEQLARLNLVDLVGSVLGPGPTLARSELDLFPTRLMRNIFFLKYFIFKKF
jgi:hypothetical protein